MPLVEMSATSSGGVRSSTPWTASRMRAQGSSKASIISLEDTENTRGRPVIRQRPLISMVISSGRGNTQPMVIFSSSAVRSPMSTLWRLRMYFTHRLAEGVPRHLDGGGLHNAGQGDDGDVGGSATDVHHHVAVGLGDVNPRADGGGQGLFNEVHPPGGRPGCPRR